MAEHDTTTTLLYADFPGLGDSWERETERTAVAVGRAHTAFAETVAEHLGEYVSALVDARCARFADVDAAVAAAIAFRREVLSAGELRVRLALTVGQPWPDGTIPMALFNHARVLAEGLRSGQLLLSAMVANHVVGNLPVGTSLRFSLRWLPEFGRREQVALLDDVYLTSVGVADGEGNDARAARIIGRFRFQLRRRVLRAMRRLSRLFRRSQGQSDLARCEAI